VVLAAFAASPATALFLFSLSERRKRLEAEKRLRSEIRRVCEGLVKDERFHASLVDDLLGHVALEGSLFLKMPRDATTRAIDYGASFAADPRLKVSNWYATPTAALPAPVSRSLFETARAASLAMARVVDAAATDHAWLTETFGELAKTDDWTRRMLDLAALDDGGRRLRCHAIRADYMLDEARAEEGDDAQGNDDFATPPPQTKKNKKRGVVVHVETNTFAASLAGPAAAAAKAHRRILAKYSGFSVEALSRVALPPNDGCADSIADALATAVRAYEATFCSSSGAGRRPVVLVVTVAEEDNELCHRALERRLYDQHGVATIRRTVAQLVDERKRRPAGRLLDAASSLRLALVPGGDDVVEVGVAYFRLCAWERYADEGWDLRRDLAESRCVEVPSAAAHLAGLKRAQVAWSRKRRLDDLLLKSGAAADKRLILEVAAPQFALDDPDDLQRAVAAMEKDPERPFVAKAARDGLREHVFDRRAILDLAADAGAGDAHARAVVVQAVARPEPRPSLVVATTNSKEGPLAVVRPSVPELGIFVVHCPGFEPGGPRVAGHLVRSKHAKTKDGGLCRGNAIVDSPLIYDDDDDDDDPDRG